MYHLVLPDCHPFLCLLYPPLIQQVQQVLLHLYLPLSIFSWSSILSITSRFPLLSRTSRFTILAIFTVFPWLTWVTCARETILQNIPTNTAIYTHINPSYLVHLSVLSFRVHHRHLVFHLFHHCRQPLAHLSSLAFLYHLACLTLPGYLGVPVAP